MSNGAFGVRGLACLLGVLACMGCGSGPSLVPVQGKVTVNGQPLAGGDVAFYPAETGGAHLNIVGKVGPDGGYSMTTDGRAGAPKGRYKVTVFTLTTAASGGTSLPDPSKPAPPPPQRKANIKYESQDKTDLSIEVPSASYDLNLSPP